MLPHPLSAPSGELHTAHAYHRQSTDYLSLLSDDTDETNS
jgi:hypothetical protein